MKKEKWIIGAGSLIILIVIISAILTTNFMLDQREIANNFCKEKGYDRLYGGISFGSFNCKAVNNDGTYRTSGYYDFQYVQNLAYNKPNKQERKTVIDDREK